MLAGLLADRVVQHGEGLHHGHGDSDRRPDPGLDEQMDQAGLVQGEVGDLVGAGLAHDGQARRGVVHQGAFEPRARLLDQPVADVRRRKALERADLWRGTERPGGRSAGPGGDIHALPQAPPEFRGRSGVNGGRIGGEQAKLSPGRLAAEFCGALQVVQRDRPALLSVESSAGEDRDHGCGFGAAPGGRVRQEARAFLRHRRCVAAAQQPEAERREALGVAGLCSPRQPVDGVLVPALGVKALGEAHLGADVAAARPVFEIRERHGRIPKRKGGRTSRPAPRIIARPGSG